MAFTFVTQMLGLCHFIENDNWRRRRTHLCVLLPRVPSGFSKKPHKARLLILRKDIVAPDTPRLEVIDIDLDGKRVSFRFMPAAGQELNPDKPKLVDRFKYTAAVNEMLGSSPFQYFKFDVGKGQLPHRSIAALVLFDEGILQEREVSGSWIVGGKERALPAYTSVEVGNLERVDVLITSFETEATVTYTLAPMSGGYVYATLTADCDLPFEKPKDTVPLDRDTPDEDFRAHYLYLLQHAAEARMRDVPIQRRGVDASGSGVYLDTSTGRIETYGTGGSDCQNSRQSYQIPFNLDNLE